MNYIWDVLLKAKSQGINEKELNFKPAISYSPYMELAFEDLNVSGLNKELPIEVNPYYRLHNIFKDLFNINIQEDTEVREALFNIIIHAIGINDLKQGLCKEEYYKKFMLRDLQEEVFGTQVTENVKIFNIKEIEVLLIALIKLYTTGTSLILFKEVVSKVFPNSIIYGNQDYRKELLIYIPHEKTQILERKLNLLIQLFLFIEFEVKAYWNHHFGILEVNETMHIEEMVIY